MKTAFPQRVKNCIYNLINRLVMAIPARVKADTVLLIRTNLIGDYVLWRNQLPLIREAFKGKKIILLGNSSWKPLFGDLDIQLVDETFWLDQNRFKKDLRYRYNLLRAVRAKGAGLIINTLSSRFKRTDDAFVLTAAKGARRIGQVSDQTGMFSTEEGYDANLYDELYDTYKPKQFDADQTAAFTAAFLKSDTPLQVIPNLKTVPFLPDRLKGKSFFVVFPGSSDARRIWKGENFAAVIRHVEEKWGWIPVFAGASSDQVYVDAIMSHISGDVINLCGKTTLSQLAGLLPFAKFLTGIDTGGVHIAALAGCPVFGMYNGSHYGRYNPYPEKINPAVFGIYPPGILEEIQSARELPEKYCGLSFVDYNLIAPQQVCNAIDRYFEGAKPAADS